MRVRHGIGNAFAVAALCIVWPAASCVAAAASAAAPVLLISLDAFRWDYCARHPEETTHLRALASAGVSAAWLIPVYPSNTFPNHYSIATGLYPAHHGIINNDFFDPKLGELFHYSRPESGRDPRWWQGEPIWATAEKQGKHAAAYFWPGSEAPIGGVRPTYWKPYDYSVPFERRLEDVVGWLKRPPSERPDLIAFYLEETNSAGHNFGPESVETISAIRLLDEHVGQMLDRLAAERIPVNVIVVSDHGMTPVSPERILFLDDYIDLKDVQIDFGGPEAGLHPLRYSPAELVERLRNMPHAKAMISDQLPARFHMSGNPRIPPAWVIVDPGWRLLAHPMAKNIKVQTLKGDHGYDPAFSDMHGILIARGPAFRTDGHVVPAAENIHLYNLMCAVLGIQPAPNDGDDRLVRAMLRPAAP